MQVKSSSKWQASIDNQWERGGCGSNGDVSNDMIIGEVMMRTEM